MREILTWMWHWVFKLGKNKDSFGILNEFITKCHGPFNHFLFRVLLYFFRTVTQIFIKKHIFAISNCNKKKTEGKICKKETTSFGNKFNKDSKTVVVFYSINVLCHIQVLGERSYIFQERPKMHSIVVKCNFLGKFEWSNEFSC